MTPMHDELIVDLFAGGGGASEAILAATGRHPDIAVNHDREAVALHAANHPTTRHFCEDIARVDPVEVCGGRPIGLLWASPDCTHHSKARGGKPAEKKIRALAWHVVRWAAKVRPRVIALENVEEFQDWGPLGPDQRPIKARKGETFAIWVKQLEGLGYVVEHRELVAADYGAPTTRKRLFLIARRDGEPIAWPEKTHAPRNKARTGDLFTPSLPAWRAAAEIIDWSLPCPSIFARKKPLAPKTHTRIARGIKRFVIEAHRPFIVPVTHNGPRATPSVDDPLATVTSANRGEFSLGVPSLTSYYGEGKGGLDRAAPVGEPLRTVTTENRHALTAASLLRTDMQSAAGRNGIHAAEDPIRTVTSAGGFALSAAHLTKFRKGSHGADVAEPMPTVTANSYVARPGGAVPLGVVAAYLGRQFGSTVSGRDLADPHPAVMSDGGGAKSQIVAASLDAYYATGVPASPEDPLRTATALPRHGLTASFLEQANTGMTGHDALDPLSTIVGGGVSSGWGTTQRLIDVDLAAAPDARREKVLQFLWEHFGEPTDLERADPLASARGRLRFGLVVLDGVVWQIADIGMRMLTPRELYGAQGFRPDYLIEITWEGRPLTKTAQTRMAGNSVSPPPAAALLRANLGASMAMRNAA